MTKRINYVGPADSRVIARATVIAAGLPDPGVDLVWSKMNSFELDLGDDVALWAVAADRHLVEDGGLDFGDMVGLSTDEINVIASGEMTSGTLQAKLVELYDRSGSRLDLMKKRWTFWEDFVTGKNGIVVNGSSATVPALGDRVGGNGFWIPDNATLPPTYSNGIALQNHPGCMVLNPITVGGWTGLTCGAMLVGTPEFRMDVVNRIIFLSSAGTEESNHWNGLHDGLAGAEPQNGVYLELSQANGTPGNWYLVFAVAGVRTKFNLGVVAETTAYHAFTVICDGATDPTFYTFIDGAPVPTNPAIFDPTNCPTTATARFGPSVFTRKVVGTGVRSQHIDAFGLDWKRLL